MTTTDDPEHFRDRWHEHVEEFERLKSTLHPDDWGALEQTLDQLHDIVDDAADDYKESQ